MLDEGCKAAWLHWRGFAHQWAGIQPDVMPWPGPGLGRAPSAPWSAAPRRRTCCRPACVAPPSAAAPGRGPASRRCASWKEDLLGNANRVGGHLMKRLRDGSGRRAGVTGHPRPGPMTASSRPQCRPRCSPRLPKRASADQCDAGQGHPPGACSSSSRVRRGRDELPTAASCPSLRPSWPRPEQDAPCNPPASSLPAVHRIFRGPVRLPVRPGGRHQEALQSYESTVPADHRPHAGCTIFEKASTCTAANQL